MCCEYYKRRRIYFNRQQGRLMFKPSPNDKLQSSINDILNYYKMDHVNRKVEEILSKNLFELCRSNPKALFSHELRNFLEDYIKKLSPIIEIENMILHFLSYILQNLELQKWFYNRMYPIMIEQSANNEKTDSIRNARIQLLWSVFRLDENKRDDILNAFIIVLENEGLNPQREVCKYICGSHPLNI